MAVQPQEAIKPLTVLELNTRIHDLLAARFQSVVVKGEVSGVSLRSGHVWFTLKDATANVGAVIFSGTARRLPFLPENGQELIVTCQVDYHAQYGRINLVVSRLDYDGAGKLRAAIELLKRRLEAEGAFKPDRKRPLPFLPRCIAFITALGHTSDRTLADLVADREARTPTAAAELVVPKKTDLLRQLGERGQRLQRAGLAALVVPAHQVQLRRQTLARLAGDLHARRKERLANLTSMLRQRDPREVWRQRDRSLQECRRRLTRAHDLSAQRMATARLQQVGLRDRLIALAERGMRERLRNLESRAARLTALAPEQTLKRGYSICVDGQDGRIIREAAEAREGQAVRVLLSAGRLDATVDQVVP